MEQANQRSPGGGMGGISSGPLRLALSIIMGIALFFVFRWSFLFMRDSEASKFTIALVALAIGIFGIWAMFIVLNDLVSHLPERLAETLRPFVFVGPALLLLTLYVVYPSINTIYISFYGPRSENFVGLENFIFIFTDPKMLITLRNNLLWLILVAGVAVPMGLLIAVMSDRLTRGESLVKSTIFLPMAISAAGAGVIWKFIYSFQPASRPQIGLLNAVVVWFGGDPVGWLITKPWNNIFLIIVMIWGITGFAMVVISAAIKGVPGELLEAARIDGAGEIRIFFNIIIPSIQGTLVTITTTILIMVLKVFDIVFVMTSGQFDTQVIASRMYDEMFRFRNFGRGSALAVLLLVAVVPVIIGNIRDVRRKREVG